jgi:hypothetical protein
MNLSAGLGAKEEGKIFIMKAEQINGKNTTRLVKI